MPVISTSQEPSWDSNVYVHLNTRLFVLVGTAYLVRSLYNLVSPNWGQRLASILASAMAGLGLEEMGLDPLPMAPEAMNTEPDLEANLTAGGQLPRRTHGPQEDMQRSQASPRAHEQRTRTPESSITASATQEQDVGVRHGTTHFEEDIKLTMGLGH